MQVIEFIILLSVLIVIFRLIKFAVKRLSLLISIIKLGAIEGVRIECVRYLYFFAPGITEAPVCKITVGEKNYSVKLFHGKGHTHAVHIVNAEYASLFMKSAGAVKVRRFVRSMRAVHEEARVYFPKTVFIPKWETESGEIPVLLFSPAPRELTYVSPERTSINVAFTGDEVYGMKIYTRTTFANFIDRSSRSI